MLQNTFIILPSILIAASFDATHQEVINCSFIFFQASNLGTILYPITVEGMEARQEKGWEIETRELTTPSFKLLKQKQRVSEEKERKSVRERKG